MFAGPTATILNTSPLVTSDKARIAYGLATDAEESPMRRRFDVLRPQRLAAPVTVYVEQFSAHPLERDAAHLYAPPDGYVADGKFRKARQSPSDTPVYEVTLEPEDGLYLLPYFGRQADSTAWEGSCQSAGGEFSSCRQTFYPDASRLFEEIDRLGVGDDGRAGQLSSKADYDFYRAVPPGGYTRGVAATERTDVGDGDIGPERLGVDFFPYLPVRREPGLKQLAQLTNTVADAVRTNRYAGALWLEGSPNAEETCYWLSLLVDTTMAIVATTAADSPHGAVHGSGDGNIINAVEYLLSSVWQDDDGHDVVGPTLIQDTQIFTARDAQKGGARAGGFVATGGHGGLIGAVGHGGPPIITFIPNRKFTHASELNLTRLGSHARGVRRTSKGRIGTKAVRIKSGRGDLSINAVPSVAIVKGARFHDDDRRRTRSATEVASSIDWSLEHAPLSGFVAEGAASYGTMPDSTDAALRQAVYSGMPVVKVGRGNAEGLVAPRSVGYAIAGGNLTATKARLLLMACLLRYGALPPARDPANPTAREVRATEEVIAEYQQVFDTH